MGHDIIKWVTQWVTTHCMKAQCRDSLIAQVANVLDRWLEYAKDFYNLLHPGIDNRSVLAVMHKWAVCMKANFAGAIPPEDFQILLFEGLKFMVLQCFSASVLQCYSLLQCFNGASTHVDGMRVCYVRAGDAELV